MVASHALPERWAAWWAGTTATPSTANPTITAPSTLLGDITAPSAASAAPPISELYRSDATLTVLGGEPLVLDGAAAIAEHAARFAYRVPDRANIARQVIDAGDRVVVEWLFTGRGAEDLVTMAARGVTWWVLDGGRIVEEVRVLDWSERVILDDAMRAAGPAWAGAARSQGWYRDFIERLLELVDFDPDLARAGAYGVDDEIDVLDAASPPVGEPPTAEPPADATASVPSAAARLRGVAGQGRALAVRLADAVVVVGLDESDRIVSERNFGGSWWPAGARLTYRDNPSGS